MRQNLSRLLVVLWAVAAATLPGVLSVAEASEVAAATMPAPSHVESEGGSPTCLPVHGDACIVCSTLRSGPGAPSSAMPLPESESQVCAPPRSRQIALAPVEHLHPSQPRAPPASVTL